MAAAGVIDAVHAAGASRGGRAAGGARPEARRRAPARLRIDTDSIEHARFSELPRWLVARRSARRQHQRHAERRATRQDPERRPFELHLSTRLPGNFWVVEVRRPGPGRVAALSRRARGPDVRARGRRRVTLLAPYPLVGALDAPSRLWIAALELAEPCCRISNVSAARFATATSPHPWPASMYQTVFATEPGSAEMPSAGRPFTAELVTRLVSRGIQIAPLLLHTGVASLEDHEPPYEEFFRVPAETAERVNAARRAGRRVVAVGTTVVRALETVTDERGTTSPGEGLDEPRDHAGTAAARGERMITGFHEPRATHLAMVERVIAAAGGARPSSHLDRAYAEAQQAGYLWHEFGDSHLGRRSAALRHRPAVAVLERGLRIANGRCGASSRSRWLHHIAFGDLFLEDVAGIARSASPAPA